jgi:hypothetical protein
MYLRETRRRNADGSEVSYLALAHNQRDPATGMSKAKVIHNFGRADAVDRDGLARLVCSISRFLDPDEAVPVAATGEVDVLGARPMGTAYLADRLWERLWERLASVRRSAGSPPAGGSMLGWSSGSSSRWWPTGFRRSRCPSWPGRRG